MPINEIFSKRKAALEKAGQIDILLYDDLVPEFRAQVLHIWEISIGKESYIHDAPQNVAAKIYNHIRDVLLMEYGVHTLDNEYYNYEQTTNGWRQCKHHLLKAPTEKALDIIEVSFQALSNSQTEINLESKAKRLRSAAAIEELNYRFREHSLGYELVGGKIVRKDSEYIHIEAIVPAANLLYDNNFSGANEEFLKAHEHYRVGNHKEAVNEALKAFESAMKTICGIRKWSYAPNATAKILIETLISNGLISPSLNHQFTGLRTLLESGLPPLRNKRSAHGQGATPIPLPPHAVQYALNMAASNIVFLVKAHLDLS